MQPIADRQSPQVVNTLPSRYPRMCGWTYKPYEPCLDELLTE